jgi:hypothetical protein
MSTITDIQMLLNDSGVFWPTQRILDAVNEAQWDVWVRSKWMKVSTPLTLTQGLDIIPIPSTIVIPQFVEDNGLRYFPSTMRELENFHRTWKLDQQGQPMFFIVWDATHLRVYPSPDTTYSNYVLWGIGYPTEITTINTTVSGNSSYVKAIIHLTLGILFDATRPDLAEYHRAQGESALLIWKKHLRNFQSHNIRRLRPGQRFDLQQSGRIQELPVYYPLEA